jgi:hypothetical protein
LVCWSEFQGLFLYMDIFSTTARETWLKFSQKLPSTYLHVFQSLFQPSLNFHKY